MTVFSHRKLQQNKYSVTMGARRQIIGSGGAARPTHGSTSMTQTHTFAVIGPSFWNQLLPSTRSTLLTGEPSPSFRSLKTALFSLDLSHSASEWCALQEALYKRIDTTQYNTIQYIMMHFSIFPHEDSLTAKPVDRKSWLMDIILL